MRKAESQLPEIAQLESELKRERYKRQYITVLKSTIYALIVVSACAVLVAVFFMPVLKIYGGSMTPTLQEGQIVACVKSNHVAQGDIVGVYYGSKLLIKRCIATSGQWVDMDGDGNVYVDEVILEEPYLQNKALGDCDISFPYQVPEASFFVMGDHRESSLDSRNTTIGCFSAEDMVGKAIFRIWPLKDLGRIR